MHQCPECGETLENAIVVCSQCGQPLALRVIVVSEGSHGDGFALVKPKDKQTHAEKKEEVDA